MPTLVPAVNLNQRMIMNERSQVMSLLVFPHALPLWRTPRLEALRRRRRCRDAGVARVAALLLAAAVAAGGCASHFPTARTPPAPSADHRIASPAATAAPSASLPGGSLPAIRVPRPDFGRPASVAAAFFTAWASVDTRDSPDASLRRCANLITPALKHELAAGQPGPAGWQAMRAEHLVSVVHVQAVTHPAGAPPPRPRRIYLRVYAQRMTTTSAGRTVTSDGITVLLVRHDGRWLVARLLFY